MRFPVRVVAPVVAGLLLVIHAGGCAKAPSPDQGATGGATEARRIGAPKSVAGEDWREFRNREGRVIRACMVVLTKDQLSIKREDGRVFTSSLALYSDADQAYAKQRKLDDLVSATLPDMRMPAEARKHVKKRDVITSLLGVKESVRDVYKSHIDRHGTLVGCRTFTVGQDARDDYAATLTEIEDLRFVLEFGAMLDAGIE